MRPSYHLFAIFLLFTFFVSGQDLLASSYSITTNELASLPSAFVKTTDDLTPLPPVTLTTDSASLQPAVTKTADTLPHLSAADTTTDSSLFHSQTSGSVAQNESPRHQPWLRFKRVLPYWDLWRVRNSNVNSSIDEDGGGSRIIGLTPGGIVIRTMITYNPPIWPLYLLLREIIRVPSFRHHHSHLTT